MNTVTVEQIEHVVVISMNRPEARNTLMPELNRELRDAFDEFKANHDMRVAVLRGEGRDFCAGADLKASAASGKRGGRVGGVSAGGITRDYECYKPIVAALQGNVLGGGLEVALATDIRIADTTARFGAPEVRWGRMQGGGATQRLPRVVPQCFAMEILLTGDFVSAERALQMGLVNAVVEEGKATEEAIRMASVIASRAPMAIRRAKEAAVRGLEMPLSEGLRLEELISRTLAGTSDLEEGTRAFLEKRPPNFTGR
jgi:enoyl-CoA hydratase/carnithine racemase